MSKAAKRERQRLNREAAKEAAAQAAKRHRLTRSLRSFGIIAVIVVAGVAIFSFFTGNGSGSSKKSGGVTCDTTKPPTAKPRTYSSAPPRTIDPNKAYTASMKTSCGTITLALDAAKAPIATNNFVFLARGGFYDGLKFHRAAKNFVIQGGDPKGDGSGGPGYSVPGEVPTDHYPVGALAAAKSQSEPAGTFGSQFFIVTGSQGASLPNDYARFGSVTKGQDIADKIGSFAPASGDGTPTQPVYIVSVSITEGAANTAGSSTSTSAP